MPDEVVAYLDRYAAEHGVESRSGVIHRAVNLLQASELGSSYVAAWAEWQDSDAALWDQASADGFHDAAG